MKQLKLLFLTLLIPLLGLGQSDTLKVKTINPTTLNSWLQLQQLSNITGARILDTMLTGKFNYPNNPIPPTPPPVPPTPPVPTTGQYVYDATQGYKLNSFGDGQADGGPWAQLKDNDTLTSVQEGSGELLPISDYWLPLLNNTTAGVTISDIKLYSYTGSGNTAWQLYAYNDATKTQTLLASFTGGKYKAWIDYPVKSVLATRLHIVHTIGQSLWPTEMRIYGTANTINIVYHAPPIIAFNDECGVNSFYWSFENSSSPNTFLPNWQKAFSGITGVRLYVDWKYIEPTTQGLNTFNPSHSGSWYTDVLLSTLKANGITTVFDLKSQAPWMQSTWPTTSQWDDNIPVMYTNFANVALPSAYKEQARTGYQIAARYGSTVVSLANLTIDKSLQWNGDVANVPLTGLNTLKYIECGNERDKWWHSTTAFQNGYQYAANLSAFYDGNLNTMGTGIGVKNADPNMQVVYAGTADITQNGYLAAIQWCKDNRGGKLCWDVFNIHDYAGQVNPEQGLVDILPLVKIAQQYNLPVWITESGYDQQAGSPNAAPAIGSKSVALVQADWILRTLLFDARNGIAKTFVYQDYDGTPGNATVFATSGILSTTTTTFHKPAGDYVSQAKALMTGFNYVSTSTTSNGIIVDVYKNTAGKTCEVIFSPTMTGKTFAATIPPGTFYTPVAGALVMTSVVSTGSATISETPIFDMLN